MNIEKEELIRRLKIAEPYNNKDVPQYVWSIINAIPDAERVGEWIERHPMRHDGKFLGYANNDIEDTRFSHLYCRECGRQMPIFEYFPYCPYCGAKMKLKDWMKKEQDD